MSRWSGAALCLLAFTACRDGTPAPDAGAPAMSSETGASDRPAADATLPPATKCTCSGGCGAGEKCLHNQAGSYGPGGLGCSTGEGLAECRLQCSPERPCPASRPHCRNINIILGGCCSDGVFGADVCCANADATTVSNCF